MADSVNRAGKSSRRDTSKLVRPEPETAPVKPWRVGVIAPQLDFNGVTLYTIALVKALCARGDEVLLIAPPGPLMQEIPLANARLCALPPPPRNPGFFAWRTLKAEVEEFAPEILHCVRVDAGPVGPRLARLFEVPLCVTVHGWGPGELPAAGEQRFDAYIAADQSVREHLINDCNVPREMNTLISTATQAVRPPDEHRVLDPRTKPVVGYLGPLLPDTGHRAFVEAAVSICGRHPDAMFTILGQGPARAELRQMIEDHGLMQRIVMVERLFDYSLAWQPFDVVFADSRQPAAASLALAAMAHGLPVVGSEGGVLFDVIEDGEDGLLVPRDNAQALAEALLRLLQEPRERLRFGVNAYGNLETRRSAAAMAVSLAETYKAVAAGEPLPRLTEASGARRTARTQP